MREGLFHHQMQDAVTAGPEETDSPLPEQELGVGVSPKNWIIKVVVGE